MNARMLLALALLPLTAHAVPSQLTHQGRLLDASGVPVDDTLDMTFRLMTAETGGNTVWSETQSVVLEQGFYTVTLGVDEASNPLDDLALEQWPLFLEVQIAGNAPMYPRTELGSVPYSRLAGRAATADLAETATNVSGGVVDASELRVNGTPVVDASGTWTGPAPSVGWLDLHDVPAAFLDGVDDDTLAGLMCDAGEVPSWDGLAWQCVAPGTDTTLSEAEVDAMVADNGYVTADELPGRIADLDGDGITDSLAYISCAQGQVLTYFAGVGGWFCGDATEDTTLREAQVDAMVADNGYALQSELFSGAYADLSGVPADADTLAGLVCDAGDIALFDGGAWGCTSVESVTRDVNQDGIDDSLAAITCGDGQVLKWSSASALWLCADDHDTPALSEADVESMVFDEPVTLPAGSTVAGVALGGGRRTTGDSELGHLEAASLEVAAGAPQYIYSAWSLEAEGWTEQTMQHGVVGGSDGSDGAFLPLTSPVMLTGGEHHFTEVYIPSGVDVMLPEGVSVSIYAQTSIRIDGRILGGGGDAVGSTGGSFGGGNGRLVNWDQPQYNGAGGRGAGVGCEPVRGTGGAGSQRNFQSAGGGGGGASGYLHLRAPLVELHGTVELRGGDGATIYTCGGGGGGGLLLMEGATVVVGSGASVDAAGGSQGSGFCNTAPVIANGDGSDGGMTVKARARDVAADFDLVGTYLDNCLPGETTPTGLQFVREDGLLSVTNYLLEPRRVLLNVME